MTQSEKRALSKEHNILRDQNSLTQNNLCHKQSRSKISSINSEFQKPTWDTYTAQDLEVLSDIITLATYTSRSSTNITPFSYMSLFRAYDVVLSTRRIDTETDSIYYQFLLKLSVIPGNNWSEKFDNAIKDIGLKTDIEQYSWMFNKSNGSESEYTIESNISFSSLGSSIENNRFDNDNTIKANENELSIALEQNHDNTERSVESTTKADSQSWIGNYGKQSPIKRDFFKLEERVNSENTLGNPFLNFPPIFKPIKKDDGPILGENALSVLNGPVSNFGDNIKFRDAEYDKVTISVSNDVDYVESEEEDPQEMEELKKKLRICFKEWRRFTIKIRAFRAKGIRQWKLAIKFHQKNLLKNYFNKWKTNYQKLLVNKRLLDEKCQEVTMRKYLMKWYNRKQYVSYIEEQAIIIEQRNLLKRCFGKWVFRIQKIDNQIELARRYNNQCCGKFLNELFSKWLSKYKKRTENKEILNETFKLWRLKFIYNLLSGANQEVLLYKYFNMWKDKYFDKIISTSEQYNYIDEGTEETLVQRVFEKWRDRYNNNVSLAEMAEDDYNMKLMRNAFVHWKRVSRKRQKVIKEIELQLKNRYFVEWYSRCLQRWKQKYRQRDLAVKVLREWRSWTAKTRRKRHGSTRPTNRELVKSKQKPCSKNKK